MKISKINLILFISLITLVLTLGNLAYSIEALADTSTFSFQSILKMALKNSSDIQASGHELASAKILEKRLSRHWYPRVFTEGKAFSTNNPTVTFVSLLGQRQILATDFSPNFLNQPGSSIFEQGTLGIDFPIYEGGAPSAAAKASNQMSAAKALELDSAQSGLYAELAQSYSSLLTLDSEERELAALSHEVGETLSKYKIGSKSNPVGYSGLLGLKNIQNRLKGLSYENTGKKLTIKNQIQIITHDLPSNWSTQHEEARTFIAHYLKPKMGIQSESPASVKALELVAEAIDKSKEVEKAKFFPRVGLFGTGDLYSGSRATGTSYTVGTYLQWNLFSAPQYGSVGQTEEAAAAAQSRALAMHERIQIEKSRAFQTSNTLEQNLQLMDESAELLREQSTVARTLFQNGSINALQLVEVVNRRVDLVTSRADAEVGLAQSYATLIKHSLSPDKLKEKQTEILEGMAHEKN